jgi:hypothetical protein
MMLPRFIIYTPASKAELRHQILTEDAIASNFLQVGQEYEPLIYHPTEDAAAISYVPRSEYVPGIQTNSGFIPNFPFFTLLSDMDRARSVEVLPEDWNLNQI